MQNGKNWGDKVTLGDQEYVRTDFRHPKLKGYEGKRVEVIFARPEDTPHWVRDENSRVGRFIVGHTGGPWVNSMGMYNARSQGSSYLINAEVEIESVRVIPTPATSRPRYF